MVHTARPCSLSGSRLAVEPETDDLVMPAEWVQTCHACSHAMFGERGTYCPVFNEFILDEKTAGQDCPEFVSSDGRAFINLNPQEEDE